MKFYDNRPQKGYHPNDVLEKATLTLDTVFDVPPTIKKIGYEAFSYEDHLKGINIPESVTEIAQFAFNHSGLKSVFIPATVTKLDAHAFVGCEQLSSARFAPASPLDKISFGLFGECPLLSSVNIPSAVTAIEGCAFEKCESLACVTFEKNSALTRIGRKAFYGATALKEIALPETATQIEERVFEDSALYSDPSHWENGVLYVGKALIKAKGTLDGSYTVKDGTVCIAAEAFKDCKSLTAITLPDSVRSICDCAFAGCDALRTFSIGKDSRLEAIGEKAFSSCSLLEELLLPAGLKQIGKKAFYFCSMLRKPELPCDVTVGQDAFLRACLPAAMFDESFNAPFEELPAEAKMCYHAVLGKPEGSVSVPNYGTFLLSPATKEEWSSLLAACNKWIAAHTSAEDFDPPDECGFASASYDSTTERHNLYPRNCLVKDGCVIGFYEPEVGEYYIIDKITLHHYSKFVGDYTTEIKEYAIYPRQVDKK